MHIQSIQQFNVLVIQKPDICCHCQHQNNCIFSVRNFLMAEFTLFLHLQWQQSVRVKTNNKPGKSSLVLWINFCRQLSLFSPPDRMRKIIRRAESETTHRLRYRVQWVKQKSSLQAKQTKEFIHCFPRAGRCSATSTTAGLYHIQCLLGNQMPSLWRSPASSSFPQLLLLSTISHGMSLWSAVLAVSPPSLLPTFSLLTGKHEKQRGPEVVKVLLNNN